MYVCVCVCVCCVILTGDVVLNDGEVFGLLVPAGELTVMNDPGAPATCNYTGEMRETDISTCTLDIIHVHVNTRVTLTCTRTLYYGEMKETDINTCTCTCTLDII